MDSILIAITGLSLALAAGMGVTLVRTLRFERRRSDARVALLEELAARPEPRPRTAAPTRPTVPMAQAQSPLSEPPLRAAARTSSLDDFELRPGGAGATIESAQILGTHHEPSAWPRRLAVIGGMAAVLCVVFLGWRTLGAPDAVPPPSTQSAAQAPAPSATAAVAQALELLSLQHAQQDGTLVISGLVQNPRGSSPLADVHATVVLLAADGVTLATSRAPLDFTILAPGAESPFVIRVPAAGSVARYRVGFRGGDDRILGHIDRRNNETVARKQAP